jgi:hypothetical protein
MIKRDYGIYRENEEEIFTLHGGGASGTVRSQAEPGNESKEGQSVGTSGRRGEVRKKESRPTFSFRLANILER